MVYIKKILIISFLLLNPGLCYGQSSLIGVHKDILKLNYPDYVYHEVKNNNAFWITEPGVGTIMFVFNHEDISIKILVRSNNKKFVDDLINAYNKAQYSPNKNTWLTWSKNKSYRIRTEVAYDEDGSALIRFEMIQ